jgi:prohibitin 1
MIYQLYVKKKKKKKKYCFNFIFISFYKTHLTFGAEFTNAVEAKQVAQQDAEKSRFLVEKV